MKTLIITGTPGTGKTAIAKKLSKRLGYYYLNVNSFIEKSKLYEDYDRKRKTRIVDIRKLSKALADFIDLLKVKKYKGIIIDSHLSHYLPSRYTDLCIVAKCGIKELSKRLKRKGFHKSKIMENIQAEIFGICYNEAVERRHKVMVVDTTKGINISKIAKAIDG